MQSAQTTIQTLESFATPPTQASEAACSVKISDRDAAEIMATAEKPPPPNEAALLAARRFVQRLG